MISYCHMRRLALLVGLVTASAMLSTACVENIATDPPGTGAGGTGGSGGAGGGGGATAVEGLYGSGSRLSAVFIDGGEGAEQFVHFYDATLDQDCNFAEAADGTVRCLPTALWTLAYADASCTEPVLVSSACDATPPQHIATHIVETCQTDHLARRDAYTVGDTATLTEVYKSDGSGCVADATFDDTTMTVHALTAADPSTFAAATITSVEVDDGLGQRVATAEDGAYRVLGAYNVARDEACRANTAGAGMVCLSENLAYGFNHSTSATCATQDVAYTETDASCGEPQAVLKRTYPNDDLCEVPNVTVHAVGDALDAGAVYSDASGTCVAANEPGSRFFEIGGEAADGVLPKLTLAEAGAGRLTIQHVSTAAGTLVATQNGTWQDTQREEACSSYATTDGTRCLPAMSLVLDTGTGYYADDQCSVQVLLAASTACASAPPAYVGVLATPVDSCASGALDAIYSLGAEHTGAVYQGDSTSCVQGTFENVAFYEIGAQITLDAFAPLEEATQRAK